MKLCKTCNELKELSEFVKDKECKDGVRNKCKECKRLERKEARVKNPEAYEKRKQASTQWKRDNKEKVKKLNAERYKRNKYSYKKYKQSINGKCSAAAYGRLRRYRINNKSDGSITTKSLNDLLKKQMFKCAYCDSDLIISIPFSVHLDHVVPLSKGGSHTIDNVAWSCKICNLSKADKIL